MRYLDVRCLKKGEINSFPGETRLKVSQGSPMIRGSCVKRWLNGCTAESSPLKLAFNFLYLKFNFSQIFIKAEVILMSTHNMFL